MSLRDTIRSVAETLDKSGPDKASDIVKPLRDLGITPNMHVGKPKEFFDDNQHTLEWYAGAIVGIVDDQAWFAVNSWLNSLDKFCP